MSGRKIIVRTVINNIPIHLIQIDTPSSNNFETCMQHKKYNVHYVQLQKFTICTTQ